MVRVCIPPYFSCVYNFVCTWNFVLILKQLGHVKKIHVDISNFASNLIFPFECVGPPIKFMHYQDLRQVSFDSLFSQFSSFNQPSILDVWSLGMKFCCKLVQSKFLCWKVFFCYLFIANNFHSFNDNYKWYYCWKIMHDITNV